MPQGDGTGPMGLGPMTGRAAGFCAGYDRPGFMNPAAGRSNWGGGRGGFGGGGRGHRYMYYATGLPGWSMYGNVPYPAPFGARAPFPAQMTAEQEMDYLKSQAEYLQDSLNNINKRIDDLKNSAREKNNPSNEMK